MGGRHFEGDLGATISVTNRNTYYYFDTSRIGTSFSIFENGILR